MYSKTIVKSYCKSIYVFLFVRKAVTGMNGIFYSQNILASQGSHDRKLKRCSVSVSASFWLQNAQFYGEGRKKVVLMIKIAFFHQSIMRVTYNLYRDLQCECCESLVVFVYICAYAQIIIILIFLSADL